MNLDSNCYLKLIFLLNEALTHCLIARDSATVIRATSPGVVELFATFIHSVAAGRTTYVADILILYEPKIQGPPYF